MRALTCPFAKRLEYSDVVIGCDARIPLTAIMAADAYIVTVRPESMVIDTLTRVMDELSEAKARFLGFVLVGTESPNANLVRTRYGDQVFSSEMADGDSAEVPTACKSLPDELCGRYATTR